MIRDAWIWCLTPLLYASTILWMMVIMIMYGPRIMGEVADHIKKALKELY